MARRKKIFVSKIRDGKGPYKLFEYSKTNGLWLLIEASGFLKVGRPAEPKEIALLDTIKDGEEVYCPDDWFLFEKKAGQ